MNRKGQFSILAALLVAIVLIATVIFTYSAIRNSPVQDQPQVLSAIDETNHALKQILGFTVGYYASVLQITGNYSYARTIATNYLGSALEHIGNIHPEWGTSFNVVGSELRACWFKEVSYSKGNLTVAYNLTGLGINNLTYKASCRLDVQVSENASSTQACLSVFKDGIEPLINLGRQNFKFYRYLYATLTWELVTPSSEPISFSNGTYLIDVPLGVNPTSYTVQVEDPRGISVVASSFSQYACTLKWDWSIRYPKICYAVNASTPQITAAPDGNYATIAQKGGTCEVTDYQSGTETIRQVYFNVTYYGSGSGNLEWYHKLNGGAWTKIENLPKGGSAASPLTRTYNATNLRTTWSWLDLNNTDIRFRNDLNNAESYVDAIYFTVVTGADGDYSTIPNENIVAEVLQNGTIRWLGQNLQSASEAIPFPPVPVKNIRVNQTINGVNQEVPFQVEDWVSDYRIPMGLTSNVSIFNNRAMLVFLANSKVSKVTIWWDGNDEANQTSYATTKFANFTFDPPSRLLSNGILALRLNFSSEGGVNSFKVTSTMNTSTATATIMRINNIVADYGASEPMYAVLNGTVRMVLHHEVEWSGGGVPNCPNVYAHIVLTLPANTTYYTYQLRLMFIDSLQNRAITDLCPMKLTTAVVDQLGTENGTRNGYPIVTNATALFYNFSDGTWAHHWSQFTSGTKGAGIMFNDNANRMLFVFDNIIMNQTGALKANAAARIIELLPVAINQVQFKYALDTTWYGAVVTFDGTTPIYKEESGTKTGLWITVEYPPTITVTPER